MKTLIYIGNKYGVSKHANLSTIDLLAPLLKKTGFKVYTASNKSNIVVRLVDMLWLCFKYRKQASYVLIDTYSTLNFYYAYFVSGLCKILNLKYIPILHGGNLPERLQSSPKLSKSIFNNAFVNIAPSLYIKSRFEIEGFHNIIHIPNSIQLENYYFKTRPIKTINMLWVRSFSKIYNPLLAIKVLKAFKNKNIEANLCMVGPDADGSLVEAKKYANKLGVKVHFTGKLTKQQWLKLSEDYNVFINTTNFDNMPVSVIEAMALGLPVVSTNVGGIPYLIAHNKNGIMVKPNAVNEFVEAIQTLSNFTDKTKKMVNQARLHIEKLDWKVVENLWINVLE